MNTNRKIDRAKLAALITQTLNREGIEPDERAYLEGWTAEAFDQATDEELEGLRVRGKQLDEHLSARTARGGEGESQADHETAPQAVAFPAITYAIASTVKEPSRMSTRPLNKLADTINKAAPVPQSKIDEFMAEGLEGKALINAIKTAGAILHFGQYPEGAATREIDNIKASTGAAFDFDFRNGDRTSRTSRADVLAAAEAKGVAVILWDTYSSGIEAGDEDMTFRAVFPFAETQAIDTHIARCNLIAEQLGFTAPGKPMPVTQGFFVQPRLGHKANARAVPGVCADQILDFSTLPGDEAASQTAQEGHLASITAKAELTPSQIADARAVIAQMREKGMHLADGSGNWHQVIGALAPYTVGKQLANEFSEGDPSYSPKDVAKKIKAKLRSGATGIGRLFEIAAEAGIANPATGRRPSAPDDFAEKMESADFTAPVGLEAVEYTLDGFLSAGVTYIAGGHGIGKSSLLVPLASIVAGELPAFEQGIGATLTRKVIYITEDPGQARHVRYGLKKHNGLTEKGNFCIVQAKRRKADAVGAMMDAAVKAHTITGPNGYPVKPLIIFDTSNACFDVENENDAAEVGRVMSSLKQSGAPVWIIGHLAKAIARDDIKAMTGRGSSAWEADAQGTAFIFAENEGTDVRYMATKKRRFEPCYIEVKYITKTDHEVVKAPWGQDQIIGFRYGVPERASPEQRREQAANRQLAQDCAALEEYLRGQVEPLSKATIENGCGIGRNRARSALADLIRRGLVTNNNEYLNGTRKDGCRLVVLDFDSPSP